MTQWRCQPRSHESQSIMSSPSAVSPAWESQPEHFLQSEQHHSYARTRSTTLASANSKHDPWPAEPQLQQETIRSAFCIRFRKSFPLQNAQKSDGAARSIVAEEEGHSRRRGGRAQ